MTRRDRKICKEELALCIMDQTTTVDIFVDAEPLPHTSDELNERIASFNSMKKDHIAYFMEERVRLILFIYIQV
jgi:hypothetical protein